MQFVVCLYAIACMAVTCGKQSSGTLVTESNSLVNTAHLDYLYTPLTFASGRPAAGIYIYSEAPDYHRVADADEGFTCVDDVARAIQVYLRSSNFSTDASVQEKCFRLIRFLLEMQSPNGYFYNFLRPDMTINTSGATSVNTTNWWSWRALYALSEAQPVLKLINSPLAIDINTAIQILISRIKNELIAIPETTKTVSGIIVPTWLPAESGTDQAATIILALVSYCTSTPDTVLTGYIRKLSDGIALMQQGDATHFPYSCILSWENIWHAYGGDQAIALMKAGVFLNDNSYTQAGLAELDNYFNWQLQNGIKSSFAVENNNGVISATSDKNYEQIAYGIRPMVAAATEAYRLTKDLKYADMAGHFAAWFFGANDANEKMYSTSTGRCFDGIESPSNVNHNAGAESTIEALLAMQDVESEQAVKSAFNKYKK